MTFPHTPQMLTGAGLGLRTVHYQTILDQRPDIPWFEALTDNYMNAGGLPLHYLSRIREHYPLTFHGVGLSLGSTDPLDTAYIQGLKTLIERFNPVHVSDHLCWTAAHGLHGNELFPMPYTETAQRHIADRIDAVQNALGQRILVENVSSYLSFRESKMTEVEFFAGVAERADCYILCDINNIHVSAHNHDFDPVTYLDRLPADRIRELHLAGYEDQGEYLLDTHGAAVHEPVWELYERALARFGVIPTLIEWDNNIPSLERLLQEQRQAATRMRRHELAVLTPSRASEGTEGIER